MSLPALFGLLGGLLVLAFVANRLFQTTRVPDVVVLMATGVIIGPLLHWVRAEQFQNVTSAFGTLALILILFGGGLELNLRETVQHFPGGLLLAVLAYAGTTALVGVIVELSLHLPRSSALLVGAVLGCTSSTIVLPVLEQMQVAQPVKVVLIVESALGDVLSVLAVGFLLDFRTASNGAVGSLLAGLFSQVGISLVVALAIGFAWTRLLPKLSEQRFWQVLTFSLVLLLYAATEAVHASGLLAVLGFGLALANLPAGKRVRRETLWGSFLEEPLHHQQIHDFHSELAFLVRTFFFVLIGVVVQLRGLERIWPLVLGSTAAIFLARWLAVQSTRWAWRGMGPIERETVLWLMPRGLITVVLALQVMEKQGTEFAFLPALAFAIILLTNLMVIFGGLRVRRQVPPEASTAQEAVLSPAPD